MNRIFILILTLLLGTNVTGQTLFDSANWRKNIINEVRNNDIQDLFLGCGDCISETRLKADSLFQRISLDTALAYIRNNSYTVRYYSFLRILALDDSSAFEYLKSHINDSTKLDIQGACMSRTARFNELIASEYGRFINYKYKGQSFTTDGRTYLFDKPDRKNGKYKAKELKKLTVLYRINTLD